MSDSEEIVGTKILKIEVMPERLFVIGDIHGCFDELSTLIKHLETNLRLSEKDLLIFIGDYIDRGPASKEVLELLLQLQVKFSKTIFLKGNHEEMLMSYLGFDGDGAEFYLQNGGKETLKSYGATELEPASEVLQKIPESHIKFFQELDYGVALAEFLFVHAGIDPGKPVERQTRKDLLWIRHAFTQNDHDLHKIIVFGHTPFEEIFFDLPYKLGIDTGLVYGNKLTCIELVEGMVYQVEARDKDVQVAMLPRNVENNET